MVTSSGTHFRLCDSARPATWPIEVWLGQWTTFRQRDREIQTPVKLFPPPHLNPLYHFLITNPARGGGSFRVYTRLSTLHARTLLTHLTRTHSVMTLAAPSPTFVHFTCTVGYSTSYPAWALLLPGHSRCIPPYHVTYAAMLPPHFLQT
eukprot:Hpha_TRINITY_DN15187_c5_g3::TRINITY_DN15187_c5_g3_i1::g.129448::m.129448